MRLAPLCLVLALSLPVSSASATPASSAAWPDLTLRPGALLAATEGTPESDTPLPEDEARWLRGQIEHLDLRLRALEAEPKVGPILTEAAKGLLFWPPLIAVVGIVVGLGTGTGASALLEAIAGAAALGAACGVVGVIVMALVTVGLEYRSVGRQRNELLQERERCRVRLRGLDQNAPSSPPIVTVRF